MFALSERATKCLSSEECQIFTGYGSFWQSFECFVRLFINKCAHVVTGKHKTKLQLEPEYGWRFYLSDPSHWKKTQFNKIFDNVFQYFSHYGQILFTLSSLFISPGPQNPLWRSMLVFDFVCRTYSLHCPSELGSNQEYRLHLLHINTGSSHALRQCFLR